MKKDNYDYNVDDEAFEQDEFDAETEVDDEDTEFEALDDLKNEEAEPAVKEILLTEASLAEDLCKKCEMDRTVYTFIYKNTVYRGYVLCKFNKDSYIFSVEDNDTSSGRKSRKFNIVEIEQG